VASTLARGGLQGRFDAYLAKWHTLVPRQVDPATCRGGTLWLTFASLRPAQPHFVRSFAPEATHQPHRGGLTIAVASPKFIGNPPDGPGPSGMLAGAHRRLVRNTGRLVAILARCSASGSIFRFVVDVVP